MAGKDRKLEIGEELFADVLLKGIRGFPTPSKYDLEQVFTEVGDLRKHAKIIDMILANAKAAGYRRVEVSVSSERYCDDCGEIEVNVVGYRMETTAEFKARMETRRKRAEAAKKAAKRRAKQRADKERADYERLKAKFEGKKS